MSTLDGMPLGHESEAALIAELKSLEVRQLELSEKLATMRDARQAASSHDSEQARLTGATSHPDIFSPLPYQDEQSLQFMLRTADGDPAVARTAAMHAAKSVSAKEYIGLTPLDGLPRWLGLAAEGRVCPIFWKELQQRWTPEVSMMDASFFASAIYDYVSTFPKVRDYLGQDDLNQLASLANKYRKKPPLAHLKLWAFQFDNYDYPLSISQVARSIIGGGSVAQLIGPEFDVFYHIVLPTERKKLLAIQALDHVKALSGDPFSHKSNKELLCTLSGSAYFNDFNDFSPFKNLIKIKIKPFVTSSFRSKPRP